MALSDLRGLASAILDRALIADNNLITKIESVNNAQSIAAVNAINW
jgi:hypothetical protein